ncbi:LOW QUALITY PROTEIN: hypothetical protein CVT26_007976 [Gymnopilus dilepis]|uniref:Uncharacterized protein n=1 Tax=Gymnopilus dilepis TaxID=231916 RepID=A0A409W0H4_9AGAR|nr:LOW QUALITY PROTEIN: hypothetical protein CVT26_007976 [Gymnopilus dilepis]
MASTRTCRSGSQGRLSGADVYYLDSLIFTCMDPWQFSYKCLRRRWAFYTWMLNEHPHDPWFQAWWEPYLKHHDQLIRPYVEPSDEASQGIREKDSFYQHGREGKSCWNEKSKRVPVADGKTVEDLGEPLWKVSTLHMKVSEREEPKDSKKGKGEAEGESKGPFRSYEGGVSGLDE